MRVLLVLFESAGSRPAETAASTEGAPADGVSAGAAPAGLEAGGVAPAGAVASALASFDRALQRAGVLLTHGRLARDQADACVTFASGRAQVTTPPCADTTGGARAYWLLQVASRDEALAWASRCPAGAGGRLAVWPAHDETERPATG